MDNNITVYASSGDRSDQQSGTEKVFRFWTPDSHTVKVILEFIEVSARWKCEQVGQQKQEIYMIHVRLEKTLSLAIVIVVILASLPLSAMTLEQVKQRGELYCGVSTEAPGFSKPDPQGNWHGLNVDICRAVAAAVLGDAGKVKFVPLTDKNHVTAILSGVVDLLSMNLTWNLSYDTLIGLDFAGVSFYDGRGFMVAADLGVQSALELNKVSICVVPPDRNLADLDSFFKTHQLDYNIIKPGKGESIRGAVDSGSCDVVSGDLSQLVALQTQLSSPEQYVMLPEMISRRPLGPVVRQGDDGWFNIVRWILFGLIIGEDNEITSVNIDQIPDAVDPEIRAVLGLESGTGKGLGLNDDWLYQMIKQVGNYGEIFDRNIGRDSELKMDRNINALWDRGGLHYGSPIY